MYTTLRHHIGIGVLCGFLMCNFHIAAAIMQYNSLMAASDLARYCVRIGLMGYVPAVTYLAYVVVLRVLRKRSGRR